MKTKPMKHQEKGVQLLEANPITYALGCEQGTGKTWMLLADAESQFKRGFINGVLVIAPKGVHVNWVTREIPIHMSTPVRTAIWSSGAGKKQRAKIDKINKPDAAGVLDIFTINIDAINTPKGRACAWNFLRNHKAMMIVDESQRIKSPHAKRTGHVRAMGVDAVSRRISSGTLIPNSPADLFSQFSFLEPGLIGTTSYRSFVAEYCELLPAHHALVREIIAKSKGRGGVPQIVARDKEGNPKYKNLEKLSKIIAPYTYRVLKSDCLDLPEKIYKIQPFELSPAQRRMYGSLKKDLRWERGDGEVDIFTALTIINKLQQVTSGFILVDGLPADLENGKARMDALRELLEDADGQVIIWARFREELKQIAALARKYGDTVEYHGGTKGKDREKAIDDFQNGRARFFVANPAAAGTGLTLTAAENVIYYSCSFNLEERLQSEDRSHRIGTKGNVIYTDIVGVDTIDEKIATALQRKEAVAAQIMEWV